MLAALPLLFALSAWNRCDAGTTGVLRGYVREASGRPVANALVTVASPSYTGKRYTDRHGFYVFLTLPPDTYSIRVVKADTSNAYAFGAGINSDQTTTLNFRFTAFRSCPGFTEVTVSSSRGDDDFSSLDVQRMGRFPSSIAPLIYLPLVPAGRQHSGCL